MADWRERERGGGAWLTRYQHYLLWSTLHEKHAPTSAERSTAELHELDENTRLEYHDTILWMGELEPWRLGFGRIALLLRATRYGHELPPSVRQDFPQIPAASSAYSQHKCFLQPFRGFESFCISSFTDSCPMVYHSLPPVFTIIDQATTDLEKSHRTHDPSFLIPHRQLQT
ncbi:hypothetical protein EG327_007528 [Venturia inaequalis]|uniref:Uncharacterized protein n=1 Tax=Venturia inaequalis TaxID=5025 RepID=A0A8H3YXU6_VENIN|nr:hypothetical protein EG327_007528 [Venturia inaequalis]